MWYILVWIAVFLSTVASSQEGEVVVKTRLGDVRGIRLRQDYDLRKYTSNIYVRPSPVDNAVSKLCRINSILVFVENDFENCMNHC